MYQNMHLKEGHVLRENDKETVGASFVRPVRHIKEQSILQFTNSEHLLDDIRINYNADKTASFKQPVCQLEGDKFLNSFSQGDQEIERISVKITYERAPDYIICEMTEPDSSFEALKKIARLQRHFYNLYKQYPNLNGLKCVCITYKASILNETKMCYHEYMQQVVYSPQGEGYVVKEVNDGNTTLLDQRVQLTGISEKGKIYKGEHVETEECAWIDLLEQGIGDGDNGSKLTAENARFQLLMEDHTKTSDSTWYLLSDKDKIIYVNALNLTDNFDTVRQWRRNNSKNPAILPMTNPEVAAAIQEGAWKDKGRGPVVCSKSEWINQLVAQNPDYYFDSISDFVTQRSFSEFVKQFRNYQGFVILHIDNWEYKIKCPEFIDTFLKMSINGTAGMALMKTENVIPLLEKRLNKNVISSSLRSPELSPLTPLKGNNTPPEMKCIWFFDAAEAVLGKSGASLVYSSDFQFPAL